MIKLDLDNTLKRVRIHAVVPNNLFLLNILNMRILLVFKGDNNNNRILKFSTKILFDPIIREYISIIIIGDTNTHT